MALLFFQSKESVLEWMDEIIEENMETHKEDCEGNLFDLHCCEEREGACWWLVRKDGAQMGNTFAMLALAVNHYIKEFENPDFTVYSIAYTPEGEKHWSVSW